MKIYIKRCSEKIKYRPKHKPIAFTPHFAKNHREWWKKPDKTHPKNNQHNNYIETITNLLLTSQLFLKNISQKFQGNEATFSIAINMIKIVLLKKAPYPPREKHWMSYCQTKIIHIDWKQALKVVKIRV